MPETKPDSCSPGRPCCGGSAKWLWALLIVALVYMQWPMLKGWYYAATGATPPADGVGWRTDFDSALAESAQTGRPVLLDFSATWCPPCKVMKQDVWPDKEVASLAGGKYIPVLADADDPKMAAVAQRYAIRAVPTILVLDKEGKVLATANFMSRGQMVEFLKQHAPGT